MSKREIADLAFKILGIAAFIFSISLLFKTIATIQVFVRTNPGSIWLLPVSFIPVFLLWCVAWYLFHSGEKLSEKIFPESASIKKVVSADLNEVQIVAFAVIGVFLIVQAIPALFVVVTKVFYLNIVQNNAIINQLQQRFVGEIAGSLIKFLIGLFLFFRSDGLFLLWQKMQKTRG